MKPTQTEIERFILAYHPHVCVKMKDINDLLQPMIAVNILMEGRKIEYIELRSIDSLTDEELKKFNEIEKEHFNKETFPFLKGYVLEGDCSILGGDYLRSIEIAVPFAGYTVEQWLESGRLKIKG